MTRVEHLLMDTIVQNVHVRGKNGQNIDPKIVIKRVNFDELRTEISPFYAKKPNMKREDPGLDPWSNKTHQAKQPMIRSYPRGGAGGKT